MEKTLINSNLLNLDLHEFQRLFAKVNPKNIDKLTPLNDGACKMVMNVVVEAVKRHQQGHIQDKD